jgi:DNA-binding response OmpR family regulator
MRKNVLIIDDDLEFCEMIKPIFEEKAIDVHYELSRRNGLDSYMRHQYCLVIIDTLLSEPDETTLLKTVRHAKPVPILIISEEASPSDKIRALKSGADDILSKPFELEECLARAQALIRRYLELSNAEQDLYAVAFGLDLVIDPQYRIVIQKGQRLELTRKEFDILYLLAQHPFQVLTREQIYCQIWNSESYFNVDDTIRFHIQSLRKKLNTMDNQSCIETVWGVGYRFSPQAVELPI